MISDHTIVFFIVSARVDADGSQVTSPPSRCFVVNVL